MIVIASQLFFFIALKKVFDVMLKIINTEIYDKLNP